LRVRQRERQKLREEEEEYVGSYWMALRKREGTDGGRGSTSSHCVENSLWKELRVSLKADNGMNGGSLLARVK
jgi:hypothetical protein